MQTTGTTIVEDSSLPAHVAYRWLVTTRTGRRAWFPSVETATAYALANWYR